MTTWLFVLVPLTALLIWAWVRDRKRNKRLASDYPADSAARRAGAHPEYQDPGYGAGKHPDGKHPELRGGSSF